MKGTWLAATAFVLAMATALPALADPDDAYGSGPWGDHMWGYGMMGGGLGGIVTMLLMVAIVVAVIVLVWKAVSGHVPAPPSHGTHGHDAAMTALRERFARGEIDEAEYQARRKVLEG